MRAGQLRDRWTIQRKSVAKSATGAEVVTWTTLCTIWAGEKPMSGTEVLKSGANIAQQTTVLSLRYRSGITPAMRATRGSRVLDIEQAINPDGRKRELELLCTEVVR